MIFYATILLHFITLDLPREPLIEARAIYNYHKEQQKEGSNALPPPGEEEEISSVAGSI